MGCQISIIMASFFRPHLLQWGLYSLAKQNIPWEFETIVVNDGIKDQTEAVCQMYKERLHLKYLFSGQRNLNGKIKRRVPGFALNIGIKQSLGRVLLITGPEIFHLNDTVAKLTLPVLGNRKFLGIPHGKDDLDGTFLKHISLHKGNFDWRLFGNAGNLDVSLPFAMAVSREEIFTIGGYDEDFLGDAYEDSDFVGRLLRNGCSYVQTEGKVIHLYHPRSAGYGGKTPAWLYNQKLYHARKGIIVRNKNREWGKL